MIQQARLVSDYSEIDPLIPCYFKQDGIWYINLPGCGLGNLAGHAVEEHEDGTISVTPSILLTGHEGGQKTQRHGYLTKGIWSEC